MDISEFHRKPVLSGTLNDEDLSEWVRVAASKLTFETSVSDEGKPQDKRER